MTQVTYAGLNLILNEIIVHFQNNVNTNCKLLNITYPTVAYPLHCLMLSGIHLN